MLSLRFNHLLVVLKIYDTGSLSETARQLNLTISAASRSLRKCQEEFGDELFVRNYQGMAPTEKCRAVVPIIRKLLANFNDLTDTKTFAPADITRTLSIAAADNAVVMILRPVLRALLREAPQMNFRLLPLSENVFRELAEGSVDLALFPTSLGETLPEHFHGLKLFDIHRVCLLRKEHPLATSYAKAKNSREKHFLNTRKLPSNCVRMLGAPCLTLIRHPHTINEKSLRCRISWVPPIFSRTPTLRLCCRTPPQSFSPECYPRSP